MSKYEHLTHPFGPLYDSDSTILILGSFPSVKSRETEFFYGHLRNRFWQVTAAVFDEPVPVTVKEKKEFLKRNHIALWDSIASLDIIGSSDSSIRNAVPTDLLKVIDGSKVTKVFCNGTTSYRYYEKYQEKTLGIKAVKMPSTSPANAAWSLSRLVDAWRIINE